MPVLSARRSRSVSGNLTDSSGCLRSSHESVSLQDGSKSPPPGSGSSAAAGAPLPSSELERSPPILGTFNWVKESSSKQQQQQHRQKAGKENNRSTDHKQHKQQQTQTLRKVKKDRDAAADREETGRIMVYVRLRPMSMKEKQSGAQCCVGVDGNAVLLTEFAQDTDYLRLKRLKGRQFTFDAAFSESATQRDIYDASTVKLVEAVLQGQNCSVFCYGATGAGKTHTMLGSMENPGVMVLALNDLFIKLKQQSEKGAYSVRLSYLEVYNESVRDLLSPGRTLALREDGQHGIAAAGLTHHQAQSAEEVMLLLQKGNQNRQTEPTRMNETSSRSHAILQVVAEHSVATELGYVNRVGKLSLIDLAGSERALATDQRTLRSLEGANINRSLLALSSCINALVEGKKHIPYRNSRLTQLLKDSLGGECQTAMIANVSPSSWTFGETQNTLHWADRAKEIRTKICINEKLQAPDTNEQAQLLLHVQQENKELKLELARLQQSQSIQASLSSQFMDLLVRQGNTEATIIELRKTLELLERKTQAASAPSVEKSPASPPVPVSIPTSINQRTGRRQRAKARSYRDIEKESQNFSFDGSLIGRPMTRLLEKKLKAAEQISSIRQEASAAPGSSISSKKRSYLQLNDGSSTVNSKSTRAKSSIPTLVQVSECLLFSRGTPFVRICSCVSRLIMSEIIATGFAGLIDPTTMTDRSDTTRGRRS